MPRSQWHVKAIHIRTDTHTQADTLSHTHRQIPCHTHTYRHPISHIHSLTLIYLTVIKLTTLQKLFVISIVTCNNTVATTSTATTTTCRWNVLVAILLSLHLSLYLCLNSSLSLSHHSPHHRLFAQLLDCNTIASSLDPEPIHPIRHILHLILLSLDYYFDSFHDYVLCPSNQSLESFLIQINVIS